MKVALLQHTPEPEPTVALAARLCSPHVDIEAPKEKVSGADIQEVPGQDHVPGAPLGARSRLLHLRHRSARELRAFSGSWRKE